MQGKMFGVVALGSLRAAFAFALVRLAERGLPAGGEQIILVFVLIGCSGGGGCVVITTGQLAAAGFNPALFAPDHDRIMCSGSFILRF